MTKFIVLVLLASAISAPAFAGNQGSQGININALVLTSKGGVLGLLNGKNALVADATVTTGKGGVLGAVLGNSKGGLLGGLLGGCGCK